MSKKKPPTTIEECNAEMELTQKKIRQYENRNKMLDRKLAIEKRKERKHSLKLFCLGMDMKYLQLRIFPKQ